MPNWARRRLTDHQDDCTVLKNPHKGWYVHYVDNGLNNPRYRCDIAPGDTLADFPGLNHMYLRLDWSDLEPAPGQFRWDIIDDIMAQWAPLGYRFSIRLCCSETDENMPYATPKWVEEAGCPGRWCTVRRATHQVWEPDYGHPVFLKNHEAFLQAFAKRYDGNPLIEFVDVGSYGNWGEGHTSSTSNIQWPKEVILAHLDMYSRTFKRTRVLANYDLGASFEDYDTALEVMQYAAAMGMGSRNDSILVNYYLRFGYSTIQQADWFEPFWRQAPVDLEVGHYQSVKKLTAEQFRAGLPIAEAMRQIHATFCGFHGNPRLWLKENNALAYYMANRMGYWLFIPWMETLSAWQAGNRASWVMGIDNRGVAPLCWPVKVQVRLRHLASGRAVCCQDTGLDARRWLPGESCERLELDVPADFAGPCQLDIRLWDEGLNMPIAFGMKADWCREDGWQTIDDMMVLPAPQI
nr:DUF4832 domain-containing protein [bacterium]